MEGIKVDSRYKNSDLLNLSGSLMIRVDINVGIICLLVTAGIPQKHTTQ